MVTKHYIHMIKMKKCGFIKNKVMECIVKVSVKKATLIPHTHVTHGWMTLMKLTMHVWCKANNVQM
jgi:hypothetical protein